MFKGRCGWGIRVGDGEMLDDTLVYGEGLGRLCEEWERCGMWFCGWLGVGKEVLVMEFANASILGGFIL